MPLEGKAVLITGAARRVGATLARTLQAAGANVMIHYRESADEARALASELNAIRGGSGGTRARRPARRSSDSTSSSTPR